MFRFLIFLFAVGFFQNKTNAQCCGAGSGSPIASGVSQGVLMQRQFEINASYQYVNSTKFMHGDSDAKDFLDRYFSQYGYLRLGYGLTKQLTMSVETGYWFNKTQIGLENRDTISSSGIGDLILFPRYDIYNHEGLMSRTEITVGMGLKIPLGEHLDSTNFSSQFANYTIRNPITVQTTSGANDFIFYGFFFHGWPLKYFRVFSNVLYIRKGWNDVGEKQGDYFSMSFFASKTVFENLALILQLKGETIAQMQVNKELYQNVYFIDDLVWQSTGSKKVFVIPQVSYSLKNITFFTSAELPLYQYVNGIQTASQLQLTAGLSYRINLKQKPVESSSEPAE